MGKTIRKDNRYRPKKQGKVFTKDKFWKKDKKTVVFNKDPEIMENMNKPYEL